MQEMFGCSLDKGIRREIMKYRKRPIIVEAFRWTADHWQKEDPKWIIDAIKQDKIYFVHNLISGGEMRIITLEGTHTAKRGDWVIKGIKGEIYPCKNDIFLETYEEVNDEKKT